MMWSAGIIFVFYYLGARIFTGHFCLDDDVCMERSSDRGLHFTIFSIHSRASRKPRRRVSCTRSWSVFACFGCVFGSGGPRSSSIHKSLHIVSCDASAVESGNSGQFWLVTDAWVVRIGSRGRTGKRWGGDLVTPVSQYIDPITK